MKPHAFNRRLKKKPVTKFMIAAAALAAGSVFCGVDSKAAGDAPWCAVISIGQGEVYWDCQYRTVEECVPNVIAGNRGFCNLNPYGPGPSAPAAGAKRHYKRHAGRS
jgi:Protein of unknown function (DUF3551)